MIWNNKYSILVAILILYLCLASPDTFENVPIYNIPFVDKLVHFGMHFLLMSVIILEHRKSLKTSDRLFMIALIPLFYGILLEILQLTLTSSRSGSFYDVIFNTAGMLSSLLLWLWIRPLLKEKSEDN